MKKFIIALAALLMLAGPVFGQSKDKYVGLFYFVWLGQHPSQQNGVYDITKLLKEAPDELMELKGTPKSPANQFHFWAEPLYGYYDSCDPWVVARHIELFINAGIDYLMLDTTNCHCYPEAVNVLLQTLKKFRDQGFKVPQLAFYTNSCARSTVQKIYNSFFMTDEWDGLFFAPEGKPLVVSITQKNKSSDQPKTEFVSDEMQEFFDVRESQWPNQPFDENAYPWISWDYPQKIHNRGIISVSTAQHSLKTVTFSDTLNCMGRGYDATIGKNLKDQIRSGKNFQNQWATVFANLDKVNNVFVTGWNEWVALKLNDGKKTVFVDTFNEECSRDIEMMKGGYGDNFYLQLAENVHRFKGDCGIWSQKGNVYKDPQGDAFTRNFKNFSGEEMYVDNSARNDIVEITVTEDKKNVTFAIRTAENVVPYSGGENWMNVLIKTGEKCPFEYNYIINRIPHEDGFTTVEHIDAKGVKRVCGKASYSIKGDVLEIIVPLPSICQKKENISFEFKVADNVSHPEDIMDYYVSGDSAPLGRMSYSYSTK